MIFYAPVTRLVRYFFRFRIVRYGFIGGICIPVHLLSLAGFLYLFGDKLYVAALLCTFEVSTTINFILNQLFTYHEQQHLSPLGWVKRALKGQLTSLTSQTVTFCVAVTCTYVLHQTPYLGSFVGIASAFFLNYTLSKRFVFSPIPIIKPIEDVYIEATQRASLHAALQSDLTTPINTVIAMNAAHPIAYKRSAHMIRPIRLQRWTEDEVAVSLHRREL